MSGMTEYFEAVRGCRPVRRLGRVRSVRALSVQVEGLPASLGEVCIVTPERTTRATALGEVVAAGPGEVTLMLHGEVQGLAPGDVVRSLGQAAHFPAGAGLLGRVLGGDGQLRDGGPPLSDVTRIPLDVKPVSPMQRPRIDVVAQTGVRVVDALLTLGRGQRIGVFAGSGVGKSTLLGTLAQQIDSDVNVIALVGERGREVREFVEARLGPEGLRKSVLIAATAEEPPLVRLRAAHAAVALARHFADAGAHALLVLDSLTRVAMARREIGLACGEPPAARGYTPSVFTEIPTLLERCGTTPSGGAVTLVATVLVEGDDTNEPLADHVRSVLDGHIVLSRELAEQGHHPAVDVLRSTSRLLTELATSDELALVKRAVSLLAVLERNETLVNLGAYKPGANPELDAALVRRTALQQWLAQSSDAVPRAQALAALRAILGRDQ